MGNGCGLRQQANSHQISPYMMLVENSRYVNLNLPTAQLLYRKTTKALNVKKREFSSGGGLWKLYNRSPLLLPLMPFLIDFGRYQDWLRSPYSEVLRRVDKWTFNYFHGQNGCLNALWMIYNSCDRKANFIARSLVYVFGGGIWLQQLQYIRFAIIL